MKALLLICILSLCASMAYGQKILVTWNANTDGVTDGYNVFCNDKPIASVDGAETTSWTGDADLNIGNNFFYLTAYQFLGDQYTESEKSDTAFVYYNPTPPCTTRKCQCADKKGWFWLLCYYWGIK